MAKALSIVVSSYIAFLGMGFILITLSIHLIDVLRLTQQYFTFTREVSMMMRRNWAHLGVNPGPPAGCRTTLSFTAGEEAKMSWT